MKIKMNQSGVGITATDINLNYELFQMNTSLNQWRHYYQTLTEAELGEKFCVNSLKNNIEKMETILDHLRKTNERLYKNAVSAKKQITHDANNSSSDSISLLDVVIEDATTIADHLAAAEAATEHLKQIRSNTTYHESTFNPQTILIHIVNMFKKLYIQAHLHLQFDDSEKEIWVIGNDKIFTQTLIYFFNFILQMINHRDMSLVLSATKKTKKTARIVIALNVPHCEFKPKKFYKLDHETLDYAQLVTLYGEENAHIYVLKILATTINGKVKIENHENTSTTFILSFDFNLTVNAAPGIQLHPENDEPPPYATRIHSENELEEISSISNTPVTFFNENTEEAATAEQPNEQALLPGEPDPHGLMNQHGQIELHGQANLHNQINQHNQVNQFGQINLHGQLNQHGQEAQHGQLNRFGQLNSQAELNQHGQLNQMGQLNQQSLTEPEAENKNEKKV